MRPRVFAIDLVDHDDRLGPVLERLAQNETGLRLRAIMRIDDEQNAIDHLHDALHFAAEIGVAGRVHDVDAVSVPLKGGVLRADRDPFFALEIHRVHHPLFHLLVGAEGAGLAQELIDERGLAVIDVRNNGDVTNLVHVGVLENCVREPDTSCGEGGGIWRRGHAASTGRTTNPHVNTKAASQFPGLPP